MADECGDDVRDVRDVCDVRDVRDPDVPRRSWH